MGLTKKNNKLVADSLNKISKMDFSESGALILRNAIVADNENALSLLLEKGIPCDNQSTTGKHAFGAAISSPNPAYIKALLDNNCGYEEGSKQQTLGDNIINSAHPEKIFMLSDKYIKPSYREGAFLKALSRGAYEQVQTMLELGANPNMPNALTFSLSGKSKVAFLLINKGADITAKSTRGVHVLATAFMRGKVDIAREILKRDPDYIQRENIESRILTYIFHFSKNPVAVRESISLLLDHGVDKSHLINSYPWFRKAINLPDYLLLDQLLDIGKGLYKQSTINKNIKYLESRDINIYHKNKMLKSLQQYN